MKRDPPPHPTTEQNHRPQLEDSESRTNLCQPPRGGDKCQITPRVCLS